MSRSIDCEKWIESEFDERAPERGSQPAGFELFKAIDKRVRKAPLPYPFAPLNEAGPYCNRASTFCSVAGIFWARISASALLSGS